jgi:adenosylcobinamide-phosphate synthase
MMYLGAETALLLLVGAQAIDLLVGEYPNFLHPVVWIGTATSKLLKLAPRDGRMRQFFFGLLLTLAITGISAGVVWGIERLTASMPILQMALGIFFFKASFALRELGRAAELVRSAIADGDLPRAREGLRSLCSRDPTSLNEEALLAGAIESLAENISDSFIAPLFYFMLLGVAGAMGYRAINTLDAMIGYRGKFEYVGKAAARLDDLVNWIPARMTAALLLLAGFVSGRSAADGWRIMRRDGAKTPSPNGGRPMACMAGLLGVDLAKPGVYTLGDRRDALTPSKVREAWELALGAAWFMIDLFLICCCLLPVAYCLWLR